MFASFHNQSPLLRCSGLSGFGLYIRWLPVDRVVTKISSCRVNITSRRGIKQLRIYLGSIIPLFLNENSCVGATFLIAGEIPSPLLLMTAPLQILTLFLYGTNYHYLIWNYQLVTSSTSWGIFPGKHNKFITCRQIMIHALYI